MNISDALIGNLHRMASEPIPADVREMARLCILDEMGAIYGGAQQLKGEIKAFLDFQPQTESGAKVIGTDRTASMEHAALLGGFCGHVFDIDDGNRFCALHPASSVIPAVLAVCDFRGLAMEDLIRGVVIGYEAATRVALCAQPSHRNRGFHASGTCGAIGAALGAASSLGFDAAQMKSALGAAVASSSGLLEMQENVSRLKPYNLGHAAMNGVTAVSMVVAGFNGPEDPLGGGRGFFKALTDEFTTDALFKLPDGHYCIMDAYHKSYAACRHCHAAIDSTLELRKKPNVTPENLKSVTIHIYEQVMNGHAHKEVPSIISAKMSVPFAVALALANGAAGIPDYTEETIADPVIHGILDKTDIVVDDSLTALVPKKRAAIVDVELLDGTKYSIRTDVARGEPEMPMEKDAFCRKFRDLLAYGGKTKEQAQKACDFILAGTGPVSELTQSL